ncbi:MAG: resolvase [Geobacter sp.]|nr:MAG: resolvase [Geobacter sp.]
MHEKRRCECLTTIGKQCVNPATVWRKHDDGNEYLVCKKHNGRYFKPFPGTGQPIQEEHKPRTIGYLRVSTDEQDLDKNKANILHLANEKRLSTVEWVEEKVSGTKDWKKRKLGEIMAVLNTGDTLIVSELSRLGRSTLQILEVMKVAKEKGIAVHAIKNGWSLNGTMESKIVLQVLAMVAEIERDLISERTKEGLKARKAAGVILGRPKGPGKSKLDPHREEIIALLKNGSTKTFVAKRYGCSPENLMNWISKNKLNAEVKP